MAPHRCLCDSTFGTKHSLRNHAIQHGHFFECECGTLFGSKALLEGHWAFCDATSSTQLQFNESRKKIPNRFYCGVCRNNHFGTSKKRDTHLIKMHNACPTCLETFSSLVDCMEHQAGAKHCYCSDHSIAFPSLEDFVQHACADAHNEGETCLTCQEILYSDGDFDRHVTNHCRGHVLDEEEEKARLLEPTFAELELARVEESNLWCKDCDWHFVRLKAYQQHKSSPRHEPKLLALDCSCGKTFSILSALVQHLESGGCSSGMTRGKLNGIVYRYDNDRRITKTEHADRFPASTIAGSSIAPDDSASMLGLAFKSLSIDGRYACNAQNQTSITDTSVQDNGFLTPDGSGFTVADDKDFIATQSASDKSNISSDCVFILTPTASAGTPTSTTGSQVATGTVTPTLSTDGDDGIFVTPPGSSTNGGPDEWAFINRTPSSTSMDGSSISTIKYDNSSKSWPCPKCERTFRAKTHLRQHMASAAHAHEIFHSPVVLHNRIGGDLPSIDFKTVSGLLQHAERESSKGATDAMKTIVEIMEKPMDKKFKASMRSLEG